MRDARRAVATTSLIVAGALACRVESRDDYLGDKDPKRFGLGRPADSARLASLDIDVAPSGAGLPAGRGSAAQGAGVYVASCASCHGASGEGIPPNPQLLGGPHTFNFAMDGKPKTIGNYWPYATTLFDYIRRAMPITAPGSLSADQTYAVTAYLLEREQVIPPGTVLHPRTLPLVKMPARDHFVPDDRRGNRGGKNVR